MDWENFYRNKRVFITGHTGFKGAWLCSMLLMAGAKITGFALPPVSPGLFHIAELGQRIHSVYGDICDYDALQTAFQDAAPEIVLHLAAQPIVREGYRNPMGTYQTNVMGTVHILECVRQSACVRSFLNITTDKVYQNQKWSWGYRETDILNGTDPYSNSKSCSELITQSYQTSFLAEKGVAVSTARAGNVIGGGDFSIDRIIPDCIRAVQSGLPIQVRNPSSIRPYQHVLEPLSAYLLIAQRQYENNTLADCYNVGPESCDCLTTGELTELFCQVWGEGAEWKCSGNVGPHEDEILKLDNTKIYTLLGWRPKWCVEKAVTEVVTWTKAWLKGQDMLAFMERQIEAFIQT